MEVTKLDSNLLRRVERNLRAMVEDQDVRVSSATSAGNLKQAKVEKAEADRQHRDIRDLVTLRKRIEGAAKKKPTSGGPSTPAPA